MTSLIFLSYSTKDQEIAETICSALENRGLTCWMSSRDISPGENFQVSIIRAIRNAAMMVMVFSGNSNNSDEVKKEIALAGQHKLLVIPVRVEDVLPAEAFQYELATRQWIDLFENWEHAIERLASQIRSVLGSDAAPAGAESETAKAPQSPETPHRTAVPATPRRSGGWSIALAALVAVALSGGAVWWWKNGNLSKDTDAWTLAGNQNTVPGYQTYLRNEPQGRHVAEANTRIDGLEWLTAVKQNTLAGYDIYKQMEPHGLHLADADAHIAALNVPAPVRPSAPAPVASPPSAPAGAAAGEPPAANFPQATAQEEADYKKALQLHSSAGYRNFLAVHGNGVHSMEVRQRLASCQMVKPGSFSSIRSAQAAERCR